MRGHYIACDERASERSLLRSYMYFVARSLASEQHVFLSKFCAAKNECRYNVQLFCDSQPLQFSYCVFLIISDLGNFLLPATRGEEKYSRILQFSKFRVRFFYTVGPLGH
eukprot:COSAG05_NODE_1084_length_5930_cov_11.147316_6_plen_110_part_00